MGLVLVFAAGYVIGARAGSDDFDEIVRSFQAIRRSEEFHDFMAAIRSHAGQTLRRLGDAVEKGSGEDLVADVPSAQDLVAKVRQLVGQS
jgi:hypothetical protein